MIPSHKTNSEVFTEIPLENETYMEEFTPSYNDEDQKQDSLGSTFPKNANGNYFCDQCEFQSNNMSNLIVHNNEKHYGITFDCDQFSLQFSTNGNLQTRKYS
jgi:hypothetical protein